MYPGFIEVWSRASSWDVYLAATQEPFCNLKSKSRSRLSLGAPLPPTPQWR